VKQLSIPKVQTFAFVVPLYDTTSETYIPCEPRDAVCWTVFAYDVKTGHYKPSSDHDTAEYAREIARKRHYEIKEELGA